MEGETGEGRERGEREEGGDSMVLIAPFVR